MDIYEIEKGIELFYAFLRKNPTLCPHAYVEFSRCSKPLEDYDCKYRLIRILHNCEYCDSSKVEYILIDTETGEELDISSLSLSTLADFFNGLKGAFDKNVDEQYALHYFNVAWVHVNELIVRYEKAKKEKEEEEEEKELYQKAYEKLGPLFYSV